MGITIVLNSELTSDGKFKNKQVIRCAEDLPKGKTADELNYIAKQIANDITQGSFHTAYFNNE